MCWWCELIQALQMEIQCMACLCGDCFLRALVIQLFPRDVILITLSRKKRVFQNPLRSKQFKHNTSPRHNDAEGHVDVEPLRSSSSPPANNLGFQLCTSAIKRWPSAVLTDEAFWSRGAKLTCPSHAFFVQMLWLVIWYLQVNCHLNGTSMIQERMTL